MYIGGVIFTLGFFNELIFLQKINQLFEGCILTFTSLQDYTEPWRMYTSRVSRVQRN